MFLEFAELVHLSQADREIVSWVILDTIRHKRENGPEDNQLYLDLCAYFLDSDLSILCADQATYDEYANRIWLEYEFVGRQVYCSKRPEVLEKLCEVNPYFKEPLKSQFESCAIPNVKREIARLRAEISQAEEAKL